jgi:Ni/Co efflux regulator RcnB
MHKMLLASAACLALLTVTAHAESDRAHGHGKGREAAAANAAQSHTPVIHSRENGRQGGWGRSYNASTPESHAMRGFGRAWNANGHSRDAGYVDNGRHRSWRVNDEHRGRTWNASENGQDNNGTRDNRGQNDNAMRGHGHKPNAAGPVNNGWHGNYTRNNAWQGGNARWHGPQNWRTDRTYWARYHRSWYAGRRYRWNGSYVRPAGWYYRRWTLGAFLPAIFFVQQYWIPDYAVFALDPPPPGTVWVRYGDDALLVDRYTGEIIQVVYGIFY